MGSRAERQNRTLYRPSEEIIRFPQPSRNLVDHAASTGASGTTTDKSEINV